MPQVPTDAEPEEFRFHADIIKANDSLRTIWGWASIIEVGGEPVVDHQGDVIDEAELVKAAHGYVSEARVGKAMHKGLPVGEVVESVVFTKAVQQALGIDLGKVGWFIAMKINDGRVWKRIKAGELRAFSIGGKGKREKIDAAATA